MSYRIDMAIFKKYTLINSISKLNQSMKEIKTFEKLLISFFNIVLFHFFVNSTIHMFEALIYISKYSNILFGSQMAMIEYHI